MSELLMISLAMAVLITINGGQETNMLSKEWQVR